MERNENESWLGMSQREQDLLMYLFIRAGAASLSEMQADVFGDLGTGTSAARNTLRRLVRDETVRRTSPGRYTITALGKRVVPVRRASKLMTELRSFLDDRGYMPTIRAKSKRAEQSAIKACK